MFAPVPDPAGVRSSDPYAAARISSAYSFPWHASGQPRNDEPCPPYSGHDGVFGLTYGAGGTATTDQDTPSRHGRTRACRRTGRRGQRNLQRFECLGLARPPRLDQALRLVELVGGHLRLDHGPDLRIVVKGAARRQPEPHIRLHEIDRNRVALIVALVAREHHAELFLRLRLI